MAQLSQRSLFDVSLGKILEFHSDTDSTPEEAAELRKPIVLQLAVNTPAATAKRAAVKGAIE